VLVHGGAGGTGHVAIQLARHAGARVCTTVSSDAKAELVTELGAELPIRYREQDFAQAARAWTDDRGVDMALDLVGGPLFQQSFPAVRVYGDLVTLLQPPADTDWSVARQRNLRIGLELMLTPAQLGLREALAAQARILGDCAALFDAGALRVELAEVLPLADAAEAHRRLEAGGLQGKLVLAIG
jgi:NADPH2:quinone reductase